MRLADLAPEPDPCRRSEGFPAGLHLVADSPHPAAVDCRRPRGAGRSIRTVAPRAAAAGAEGRSAASATEMLGQYLATAPDDGTAWLQLGRFYLLDTRDWHLPGTRRRPPGPFYLDFAATALDQAAACAVDSGVICAQMLEVERAAEVRRGARARTCSRGGSAVPERTRRCRPTSSELGANLLSSCPSARRPGHRERSRNGRASGPCSPPPAAPASSSSAAARLYATDARYRNRMAAALGIDSALVGTAGAGRGRAAPAGLPDAARRIAAAPLARLRRCAGARRPVAGRRSTPATGSSRSRTSHDAGRQRHSPWLVEVRRYSAAAGSTRAARRRWRSCGSSADRRLPTLRRPPQRPAVRHPTPMTLPSPACWSPTAGEIALRIIRACHEEGLEAVAVYSDADRAAPHVRAADSAVDIGPAAAGPELPRHRPR